VAKLNISENKEIFELKKKCKVVQDKISRVVETIPPGSILYIEETEESNVPVGKEREKDERSRDLQN
jgi:hypothetical protein